MADAPARDWPVPIEPSVRAIVGFGLADPQARFSLRTRAPSGLPARVMESAVYGDGHALCLGPDEWLLILPEGAPPPSIAGLHALVDVSDRSIGIGIGIDVDGPGAAALLQTGCALDLARDFPPGKATRTVYDGVEIVLWRTGDTHFRVEVWRSFAAHLWAAFDMAAGDLR